MPASHKKKLLITRNWPYATGFAVRNLPSLSLFLIPIQVYYFCYIMKRKYAVSMLEQFLKNGGAMNQFQSGRWIRWGELNRLSTRWTFRFNIYCRTTGDERCYWAAENVQSPGGKQDSAASLTGPCRHNVWRVGGKKSGSSSAVGFNACVSESVAFFPVLPYSYQAPSSCSVYRSSYMHRLSCGGEVCRRFVTLLFMQARDHMQSLICVTMSLLVLYIQIRGGNSELKMLAHLQNVHFH